VGGRVTSKLELIGDIACLLAGVRTFLSPICRIATL
jgi:hypothetical protein